MPAKKYSNKSFNKDLKHLKKLINSYKGGDPSSYDPFASMYSDVEQSVQEHRNIPVKGVVGGKPKRNVKRSVKKSVKRSVKRSVNKVPRRSFTIVEVDSKKIPSGEGRYTIKESSSQTPANAASKACTRALAKRNKNKLVIKVRETTAGSEKKVKCYDCSRTKLKTPIKIDRGGTIQLITHKTNIKERVK